MAGGAPTRVRSSIAERTFLVDVFVNLFEVRAMETEVRQDLEERAAELGHLGPPESTAEGLDFRLDVERWLDVVAR